MKLKAVLLCVSMLVSSAAVVAQNAADHNSPEHQAARQAVLKACDADIKSTCSDKQRREVYQCLRSNNAKLGAGCKDALSKFPAPQKPAT